MLGIYFSGTGNSRYALEAEAVSIEDEDAARKIRCHTEIIFSYPVQYSNIPKMVKDFVYLNAYLWDGKKVFIIATMGMFSGDGAGLLGRRLRRYGAQISGGLHLKMPDSIADVWALKRPLEKNKELVCKAERKIAQAALRMKNGDVPQDGMGFLKQMVGLFGQRLYFSSKTAQYTERIKVDTIACNGCGKCAELCPMESIQVRHKVACAGNRCTMCYRCINNCPQQAITLIGRRVREQGTIEKYLS